MISFSTESLRLNIIVLLTSLVVPVCATGASDPSWFRSPPRIVQTLLREPDVKGYDVARIVAYLQSVQANCIVINGGGVIDFFRWEHEMANPTPYLEARDIITELTEACHRVGIRVIARVDFRGVEEARYRRRPEWFAASAGGGPSIRDNGLYQTCFNGGFRNEYGVALIRHLLSKYHVDGIWYNAVGSQGACYCSECERKFRAGTGAAIPRVADAAAAFLGPEMAEYRALKAQWALEHLGRVRDAIKAFVPNRTLSVEIFGMYATRPAAWTGIDVGTVAPMVDFLLGKVFVDDGDDPAAAGTTIRYLHALDPAKPVVLLTSTNRNKFRLMAENPVEVETALWETVAAGGGIWNALVAGANPDEFLDRRNARTAGAAFAFLQQHGALFAGRQPFAEVKILYSTSTRDRFPGLFRTAVEGAERVLAESHMPYGFLPAEQLGAATLAGVKVLLLPNAAALEDAEIAAIRDYVGGGGTLVADFQTSLYDSEGKPRSDFGLADVFGVSYAGEVFDAPRDSPHKIRQRHPMLAGWEATELLINGGRTARCKVNGAEVIATRVPPPRAAVPERGWIRTLETDDVTIAVNRFGRGQAIYFAHEIMRQSFEDGHLDFSGLLMRAIELGLGEARVLRTNAPPSVRCSLLTDNAGGYTLSLVNHTSTPYRPLRTLVPVRDIEATLRLPQRTLKSWSALTPASGVEVATGPDGHVKVRVSHLQAFASVALTMENQPSGGGR